MNYLTQDEYAVYCDGVSDFDVMFASRTIDAYIGKEINVSTAKETVTLNKRGVGKLTHNPVIDILSVEGIFNERFGVAKESLNTDSVLLDEFGFFSYCGCRCNHFMIFGATPKSLVIEYRYGYEEIPEDIKIVCGIIAMNIFLRNRDMGGISNAKQLSTMEFNVVLFDDKIMSSNERTLLNKYKDV